ncbi:hypothetical protein [Mucilaginibacter glaciei]|uniref:Uncharacterized protein n=1 Tax=Mucilaginibacter glaciei TaxID=2772109 RepID=A0A926NUN6_9SPHI|nr:hypothetical protein [Mucilaginibacter glaciei]MBD1392059.1 hypothetical protein [Mucilaginibacter glaciei]
MVKFEDMTVTFKGMAIDSQALVDGQANADEKAFTAWIGYKLTPALVHIQSDHLNHITLKERFETSLTLMNDGQHCDLTHWKHYLSGWRKLTTLNGGNYKGIDLPFHDPQTQKFPAITKDELKQQIENHCGAEWVALLENYKNVFTEPCAVSLSKIYICINARDEHTGKAVVRNIVINTPMGD